MDERRVRLQRGERIEDGRKRFVFDPDSGERFLGTLGRHGGHCGNPVTGVIHTIASENGLILKRRSEAVDGNIRAGENSHHARHIFGRSRIDVHDAGRGDAGAFDARVQHVRQREIGDVTRLAEDMTATVRPRHTLADGGNLRARFRNDRLERIRNCGRKGREFGARRFDGRERAHLRLDARRTGRVQTVVLQEDGCQRLVRHVASSICTTTLMASSMRSDACRNASGRSRNPKVWVWMSFAGKRRSAISAAARCVALWPSPRMP